MTGSRPGKGERVTPRDPQGGLYARGRPAPRYGSPGRPGAGAGCDSEAGRRDAEADDLAQAIADESTVQGVQTKVFFLDDQLFEEISPVEHGAGIMIEIDLPEKPAADDRIRKSDVLYLDGVQDAGNAGTLIRTAVASGVRVIAASRKTASLWARR